ncbi:hypothetical protein AB0F72_08825 [Actinoplanes sp. NPDC023936]|uniref:hypothetical protein n=1 Tax=Actinoplanes sp. NPDC023936 TaxID=3154910 RepID=UPI0033F843A3
MPIPVSALLRPDDIPAPATQPVAGQGWIERTRIMVGAGPARDLRRSAERCYGNRPMNLLVPQVAPLRVKLNLAEFTSPQRQRQQRIRKTVWDLLNIQSPGIFRTGLNSRVRVQMLREHYNDQARIDDASLIIRTYQKQSENVDKRLDLSGMPWLALLPFAAIFVSGVWVNAPLTDQTFQVLAFLGCFLAVFVAWMCINAGWRHGYQQALWHMAESAPDNVRTAAEQAEQESRSRATFKKHIRTRRMGFKLRRPPAGEGYLYVIGFDTNTVKVGQTEDPKRRFGQHRAEADAFGVHITNYWISPAHSNFKNNETRLINQCVKVSRRTRKEYFHEVGYDRAVEFAMELKYFSADAEQTSTEGVWA